MNVVSRRSRRLCLVCCGHEQFLGRVSSKFFSFFFLLLFCVVNGAFSMQYSTGQEKKLRKLSIYNI